MNIIRASAPGKVVLCGEYAVLAGAPAVAMAVNRRAVVTLDATGPASVRSIGISGKPDTRLLDAACVALEMERPGLSFELDTRAFRDPDTKTKYGIGSSAALAVALVKALAGPDASLDVVLTAAQMAHRDFQGGRGSGVDIATSVAGGLITFSRSGLEATAVKWPDGLQFALLWSGVAATTSHKISIFSAARGAECRALLLDAAAVMADVWMSGDAAQLMAEYAIYIETLRRFDAELELGIFAAGHEALTIDAQNCGLVYKPCGAGGGDIGIVLGTDAEQVRAFAQRADDKGFKHLDMTIDWQQAEAGEMRA